MASLQKGTEMLLYKHVQLGECSRKQAGESKGFEQRHHDRRRQAARHGYAACCARGKRARRQGACRGRGGGVSHRWVNRSQSNPATDGKPFQSPSNRAQAKQAVAAPAPTAAHPGAAARRPCAAWPAGSRTRPTQSPPHCPHRRTQWTSALPGMGGVAGRNVVPDGGHQCSWPFASETSGSGKSPAQPACVGAPAQPGLSQKQPGTAPSAPARRRVAGIVNNQLDTSGSGWSCSCQAVKRGWRLCPSHQRAGRLLHACRWRALRGGMVPAASAISGAQRASPSRLCRDAPAAHCKGGGRAQAGGWMRQPSHPCKTKRCRPRMCSRSSRPVPHHARAPPPSVPCSTHLHPAAEARNAGLHALDGTNGQHTKLPALHTAAGSG